MSNIHAQMDNNSPTLLSGRADLMQSMRNIIASEKNSDPLRPEFGLGAGSRIDRPLNTVRAYVIPEINRQVAAYEPRVKVMSVNVVQGVSSLEITVIFKEIDLSTTEPLSLTVSI